MTAVTTKTRKPVRVSKQSSNFLHIALGEIFTESHCCSDSHSNLTARLEVLIKLQLPSVILGPGHCQ